MNEDSKERKNIAVVIATGQGPLHFIESGSWIARSGIRTRLILGWVPKRSDSFLCQLASWIVGRDLSNGFKRRILADAPFEIVTTAFSEIVHQCAHCVCSLFKVHPHITDAWTWALLGFQSRQYLKGFDILQVRSGAGQGGLIRKAKKLGMKVIVDHSCLHPATCGEYLRDDYARWHQTVAIAPGIGVWKNVEKDCQQADCIVVISEQIKESFIAHGYPAEKIRVVYLGTREDFFGIKTDYNRTGPLKILYTGAFSVLKGAEYLLESVRILVSRGINVECNVIGPIDISDELKNRYSDVPVHYVGRIPQDSLKEYLRTADVYCFLSLADGCAKAGMEAMAAGLCVVATPTSSLPLKDGETGYLVPPKNAKATADRLEWLCHHPEMLEKTGKKACELIRNNYKWEDYVREYTNVYEELLDR